MLVVSCASSTTSAPKMMTGGAADPRDQHHRIPDRLAEDDDRRAGHGDADERERRHRGRQAERLAERLRALAARVAREVGDVQAERRPVADVGGQRGGEELPERHVRRLQARPTRSGCGRGRRRGGSPSRAAARRRRAAAAPTSSSSFLMPSRPWMMSHDLDRARRPRTRSRCRPARPAHAGHAAASSVFSARPPIHVWMPNQPHATSARSIAGTFAPLHAEAGAAQHRERDAVLRAGVRVQDHRHEHDRCCRAGS